MEKEWPRIEKKLDYFNDSLTFVPQSFFSKRKASNLEAYVEWFNRLSYLIATEICMVSTPFIYFGNKTKQY